MTTEPLPTARMLAAERRTEPDWLDGRHRRDFDAETGVWIVKLVSGDCHVSPGGEMLATILGSCVSACIRDPIARVGGMNHFLLPGEGVDTVAGKGARYGAFAMEQLINGILNLGGRRDRLEVKVFGGGNVTSNSAMIGSRNAAFVREFLSREGFAIASEDLEGTLPRRVHYWPETGRVLVRKLGRKEDDQRVVELERRYQDSITAAPTGGEIDLF